MGNYIYADVRSGVLTYEDTAKRDLLALLLAYPQTITGFEKSKDGMIDVVMRSGRKLIYDDKKTKTYEQKLADPDLQDMMEQVYPLSDIDELARDDFDPGRIRVYGLFEEAYGATQATLSSNLVSVSTGNGNCRFNGNNNAASALKAVFAQITGLIQSDSKLYGFVYPLSGTFNYRVVAGTNRLSMHSFGIAVDLKLNSNDYWRFVTREQGQKRLTSYPKSLVKAFENQGFIWGGKWAHFDIVHYEYRPELILKSKYLVKEKNPSDPWYCGFPDTQEVRRCIQIVDAALN